MHSGRAADACLHRKEGIVKRIYARAWILAILVFLEPLAVHAQDALSQLRAKVNHIVVIYQENWSFDSSARSLPRCQRNRKRFNRIAHAGGQKRRAVERRSSSPQRQGCGSELCLPVPERAAPPVRSVILYPTSRADGRHRASLLHAAASDRWRPDGQVHCLERQRRAGLFPGRVRRNVSQHKVYAWASLPSGRLVP